MIALVLVVVWQRSPVYITGARLNMALFVKHLQYTCTTNVCEQMIFSMLYFLFVK